MSELFNTSICNINQFEYCFGLSQIWATWRQTLGSAQGISGVATCIARGQNRPCVIAPCSNHPTSDSDYLNNVLKTIQLPAEWYIWYRICSLSAIGQWDLKLYLTNQLHVSVCVCVWVCVCVGGGLPSDPRKKWLDFKKSSPGVSVGVAVRQGQNQGHF